MDTKQKNRGSDPQRRTRQGTGQRSARTGVPRRSGTARLSNPQRRRASKGAAPSNRRPADYRSRNAARAKGQQAAGRSRRRIRRPRRNMPAVVYTQPAPFNRNRLLLQLLTVTAVVLALVMGLSVFFKVKVITVSGAETYSAWAVREASGIAEGDNLLTFSRARAAAQIRANLPYVNSARIGIKLPDTVIIVIEEIDVVYSIQSADNLWWFITSEGRIVEQTDGGTASNYTEIRGVKLESPIAGEIGIAQESSAPATVTGENTPTDSTGETLIAPPVVTGKDRLDAALQILQALELNDIVGEAAWVDVTDLSSIELKYGRQYEVLLGDTTQLDHKIASMKAAIAKMNDYEMGILDVSFSMWTDKVVYTPDED